MAAIPPQTTLNSGSCYACYGASVVEMLELSLLDMISQNIGNVTPVDPYDGLLVYTRQGLGDTTVVNPVGFINLSFGANKVTAIHCHNCPLITRIDCTSNILVTLDLQNLPAITDLNFGGASSLTAVNLDTFTSISGDINFLNCTSLSSFSASNLASSGNLFFLTGCALVTLSLPSLVSVGDFSCGAMSTLTSVSLPLLQTATGYIYVSSNTALTSLSLPSLVTTPVVYAQLATLLQSISLPALETVGPLLIDTNPVLASIDVSSLQSCDAIGANDCPSLVSFAMPAYVAVLPPSGMNFSNGASLQTFSAGTMIASDGAQYFFDGCDLLQASVNNLIQSLTDGGTTTSELDTSGGTSAAPDAGHAAQVIVLNGLGNIVTTN